MSTGHNEGNLTGICASDASHMHTLPDDVIDTHSVMYHIKNIYDAIHHYLRLELLVLAVLESGMLLLFKRLKKNKSIIVMFACINCLISLAYIFVRLSPATYVQKVGAIIAVCVLIVGMSAVQSCINACLNKEKNGDE